MILDVDRARGIMTSQRPYCSFMVTAAEALHVGGGWVFTCEIVNVIHSRIALPEDGSSVVIHKGKPTLVAL